MKRILAAILAFLYLSTSMGATIHLHYCMGKLISWGLINHDSKNCAVCGMEKQNGMKPGVSSNKNCCRDEHKTIATGKDKKLNDIECRIVKLSPDATILYFQDVTTFRGSSVSTEYPNTNAPPYTDRQPIFLLNRNFRI